MAMPITSPFLWGKQGQMLTPEQVARERDSAAAMGQGAANFKPAGHWAEGLGRVVQGLMAGYDMRRADNAEAEGLASADAFIQGNPTLASYLGGDQQAPQGVQTGAQVVDALYSQQGGNFPASLIQSESGGNWNALNSEGYGGRLQFGEARLADAARAGIIPAGMTGAQFSRLSPEQQQAVENWHFADIDSQAERMGLNRFLGQNIGGTQVTQDGIRAMAHLGGIGGAKRFLESGGQHNPADSNGTSLAKYLAQHGGGGAAGAMSAAPSQAPNSVVAALAQASANPWVQKKYGPVIEALMGQEMQRSNAAYQQQLAQQDPMYQAQLQAQQLQNQALMNPAAPKPVYEGGQWWDTSSGVPTPLTDPQKDQTSAMQNYQFLLSQGVPPDQAQAQAFGGGVTVNNNMGGDQFNEAFAKGDAAMIGSISEAGIAAQRNLARIDQLESLLSESPSGFAAAAAQRAGEWGINTQGLDTLQAAQAMINSLVPEQRQPGSGPMSDADLALFKQSLPRLINQPGGNQLIIQTMRAIAQYDAEGAQITQALRSGQIDRAQAFQMLQDRQNPMAGFKAPEDVQAPQQPAQTTTRRRWTPDGGLQ